MDTNRIKKDAVQYMAELRKARTQFAKIDRMARNEWTLPSDLPSWVRRVVRSDPSDALVTATRVLALNMPQWEVRPVGEAEEDRDHARSIENFIRYQYELAARRNPMPIHWQIVESALKYGSAIVQVDYLPYLKKLAEGREKDTVRFDRAMRQGGDFAFRVHSPANVFPVFSPLGLEAILCVGVMPQDEFVAYWGPERCKALPAEKDGERKFVTFYDYTSYEGRYVWAMSGQGESELPPDSDGAVEILNEKNEFGFLNWAVGTFGRGLLQTVVETGQWDDMNLAESLTFSLTVLRVATPVLDVETPDGKPLPVDYTNVAGQIAHPPGTSVRPLPPTSIDPEAARAADRMSARMSASTVARVLQNIEVPAGTAFSTINQVMMAATSSIAPYKVTAERVLGEIAHIMLRWYKTDRRPLFGVGASRFDAGRQYMVASGEYDPENMVIRARLRADVPTDRLASINAAVLLSDRLSVPVEVLLEELGYPDAQEIIDQKRLERLVDAQITHGIEADALRIRSAIEMDAQSEMEARRMEAERAAQEFAQLQAQQQQQMPPAGMGMAAPEMQFLPGQPGPGNMPMTEPLAGVGFNPAEGGIPPIMGAPPAVRENITGGSEGMFGQ